jgi:hypothetical protein
VNELTVDQHCDPACDAHPHCPFCGGVMVEDAERVTCVSCGTDAPLAAVEPERVAS